jgi:hypothetical protein
LNIKISCGPEGVVVVVVGVVVVELSFLQAINSSTVQKMNVPARKTKRWYFMMIIDKKQIYQIKRIWMCLFFQIVPWGRYVNRKTKYDTTKAP